VWRWKHSQRGFCSLPLMPRQCLRLSQCVSIAIRFLCLGKLSICHLRRPLWVPLVYETERHGSAGTSGQATTAKTRFRVLRCIRWLPQSCCVCVSRSSTNRKSRHRDDSFRRCRNHIVTRIAQHVIHRPQHHHPPRERSVVR